MLGGLGNLTNLLKSAKDMQGQMTKMQEELATKRFDGDGGGGMVRVVVDGKGVLLEIKIDPSAVADVELLEDLIKAAIGTAVTKAHDAMKQQMAALTGGLNIPGLSDMFGGS